jgi:hypothetical protein
VVDWSVPRSMRVECSFLGLASYYRCFNALYDDIAALLTKLHKDGFAWTADVETVFQALQHTLTTASVLQLRDFDQDFIVECDASGHGLDVVLHQGSGLVAFFSHQMAQRHSKLAAYKRELITLVKAVKHWRPYLWGRLFVIRTDHYSLKFLLDQRLTTLPQHQWASKLIGFDFKVAFKPGTTNVVVDALSLRDTETATVVTLSIPSFPLFGHLHRELDTDPALNSQKEEATAEARGASWAVMDSLITINDRVYVTTSSAPLQGILNNVHGAGHEGTEKTLHWVHANFHIPGAGPWCASTCAPASYVNATKVTNFIRLGYCNL